MIWLLAIWTGDSKPDLIVASWGRINVFGTQRFQVRFLRASLAPAIWLDLSASVFAVTVSDLDSDGNPGVRRWFFRRRQGIRDLWQSTPLAAGSFLPQIDLPSFSGTNSWGEMLVADLDGDGLREIVLGDIYGENAIILLNRGDPDLTSLFLGCR